MSFLIRAAFWLSLVILILPSEPGENSDQTGLSTAQALTAAQATLNDFTTFCARQPSVCAAGEVAIESFSAKARYGAKQLYHYLDGDEQVPDPAEATGLSQAPSLSEDRNLDRQQLTLLAKGNSQN